MKKTLLIFCFVLIFLLGACGTPGTAQKTSASPSATGTEKDFSPGGPAPVGTASPRASAAPSAETARPSPSVSSAGKLYDPSIFVIKASGKYKKELAPGYYANYACDIYLHKIDANDNRAVTGTYQGVFWMKVTIDASDYIKKIMKNVPVKINFDAGGEAVSDNFGIVLNTEDDKAWVNYNITDDKGKPLPLTQDTPVAKGSFVAVSKQVYLKAKARGAQGEKVDYSNTPSDKEVDVNYIVHVQPDSAESGTERKVVFLITDSSGGTMTVEGTMRRLPGTTEDVAKYLNSKEYKDAAMKHLQ